jgi:hypothetical protein
MRSVFSGIGAVAFVALAAMWARSHVVNDVVILGGSARHYYELTTVPGHLRITLVSGPLGWTGFQWYRGMPPSWVPIFGQQVVFGHEAIFPGLAITGGHRKILPPGCGPSAPPAPVSYRMLAVPFPVSCCAALLVATAPIFRTRRLRHLRARRIARGQCPECGYDMRATPGACPECGARVTAELHDSPFRRDPKGSAFSLAHQEKRSHVGRGETGSIPSRSL